MYITVNIQITKISHCYWDLRVITLDKFIDPWPLNYLHFHSIQYKLVKKKRISNKSHFIEISFC